MRLDFNEIKHRVSLLDAARVLQLELKEGNGEAPQYRGICPTCKAGGERALTITPGQGFYCQTSKEGGSVLDLVIHIKQCTLRQSAEFLATTFLAQPAPPPQPAPTPAPSPVEAKADELQPLKNLDTAHKALEALKLPQDVATAIGAGYCSKGLMRGLVAIPMRTTTGKLIGYIGVTEAKLPTTWRLS